MNIALLLSGGKGTRLCPEIPKQYILAGGKPVISYSMERLARHGMVDAFWIAAQAEWHGFIREWVQKMDINKKFMGFTLPGQNRQLSVYYGMEAIMAYAQEDDNLLIHDAARPMLSGQMVTKILRAVEGHDGVLPVLPMKDTVYCSADGKSVSALLNRSEVFAGQAPEVFKLGKYYKANKCLLPEKILKIHGSSEPAVMDGMDITLIAGDEGNFKITTQADLERFQKMVFNSPIS